MPTAILSMAVDLRKQCKIAFKQLSAILIAHGSRLSVWCDKPAKIKMDLKVKHSSPLKKLGLPGLGGKRDQKTKTKTNKVTFSQTTVECKNSKLSQTGLERRRWFHKGSHSLGRCVWHGSRVVYIGGFCKKRSHVVWRGVCVAVRSHVVHVDVCGSEITCSLGRCVCDSEITCSLGRCVTVRSHVVWAGVCERSHGG